MSAEWFRGYLAGYRSAREKAADELLARGEESAAHLMPEILSTPEGDEEVRFLEDMADRLREDR